MVKGHGEKGRSVLRAREEGAKGRSVVGRTRQRGVVW